MAARGVVSKPKPDADKMVQVAIDAELLGCDAAATKNGVSLDTVTRYRAAVAADPILRERAVSKKAPVVASWIEKTAAARETLLDRVLQLAALSDDLHDVTGAYKIVHDSNVAERVIEDGLGQPSTGAPVARTAAAQAAGGLAAIATRLH